MTWGYKTDNIKLFPLKISRTITWEDYRKLTNIPEDIRCQVCWPWLQDCLFCKNTKLEALPLLEVL